MKYALIVEYVETDTFSTFFFDNLAVAIRERDLERNNGNVANIYIQMEDID